MTLDEVDIEKVTPMMKEYIKTKQENKDNILFYRLGDFYEMFFDDAILVSRELELTLTGKSAGLEERIPMCGIPHHAANVYIEKLVEKGYKVAICEQLEDPKKAKGIVKRGVIQIISKGTVMDESLDEKDNNYIGNIMEFEHSYIVSYSDLSTGFISSFITEKDISKLVSEIVSLGIKEVIVNDKIDAKIIHLLKNQFKITISHYNEELEDENYHYIYEDLNDIRFIKTIKNLLGYMKDTQKRELTHLQKATIRDSKKYLKMDIHTKRNLELTETLRLKQRNYSLLWLLDKTKTAMGSRLLKNRIENPFIEKKEIIKRYDMVEVLLNEFILKDDLCKSLFEVYDLAIFDKKL